MAFSLKLLLFYVLCLSKINVTSSSCWGPSWWCQNDPVNLGVEVITQDIYDNLRERISQLIASLDTEAEQVNLAGAIVRLAINDMLDYDEEKELKGGSDGCLTDNTENLMLLEYLWASPGGTDREFLAIRNTFFEHMSAADFWVASAAVVLNNRKYPHSVTEFEFRWGRTDATADECDLMRAESRAPDFSSATGCEELEEKLVGRMGMTWLEVVSLMGYHTLGADENGHAWTDHTVKSFDFDNSYYRDLMTDGWVPRDETAASWGWGGQISHPVVMYPKDLCLFYDLEVSETQCCTNGVNSNCQDANGIVLPACEQLPDGNERKNAVLKFSTNEGENINSQDFLTNFGTVFRDLSLNGWGWLYSPWHNSTEVYCRDSCHFDDTRNVQKDCGWVAERPDPRCGAYGHYCPITCGDIGTQYFPEKCQYQNAPIDTGLACETIE